MKTDGRFILYAIALALGLYALTYMQPQKPPFVYHYQWPGEWGDQKHWICTGKGHGDTCPASHISSEL
jgi:hypothetical protein